MKLQRALLSLGEFEAALNNVSVWLDRAQASVEEPEPIYADPKTIEAEIAKLKVFFFQWSGFVDVINVFF